MGLIHKAYGNITVVKVLRGQRRAAHMSAERLRSLRDARVRDTVSYAAKTVPFYAAFFKRERLDPREIKTAEDLACLPLVTQDDVRADPLKFVSASRQTKSALLFHTSGSTGIPLDIYHDKKSFLQNIAYGERERAVLKRLVKGSIGRGRKPRSAFISYPGNTLGKVRAAYRDMTFIPNRPEVFDISLYDSIEDNIKALNDLKPDVVGTYGSYLDLLFREARSRGLKFHLPRVFIYGSDNLSDEIKELIEREYKVPVLSLYNAMEAFKIAFTCEERGGFHIHDDLCHLRIITADGSPAPAGTAGRIVVSNLVNRATVLLNYAIGDMGSLATGPCRCGSALPVLQNLEGRVDDFILAPDGRLIHPRLIWRAFASRSDVLQYQFVQRMTDGFELKIIAGDRNAYERVISDIISDLRSTLGKSAKIEAAYCEKIERSAGGKLRPVMPLIGKRIR
jgi:phenylacetate-CoA ligase